MSYEITRTCPVQRMVTVLAVPQQVSVPQMVGGTLKTQQGIQMQFQQFNTMAHEFEAMPDNPPALEHQRFYCKFCLQFATQRAWTTVLNSPVVDQQNGLH